MSIINWWGNSYALALNSDYLRGSTWSIIKSNFIVVVGVWLNNACIPCWWNSRQSVHGEGELFFFPLFLYLKCWRIIAIAAHAYTISRDTPKLLMQILSTLSRIGKRIQILQLSPCSVKHCVPVVVGLIRNIDQSLKEAHFPIIQGIPLCWQLIA